MSKAIMIVPNTKAGFAAIQYLAEKIVMHNILIKMVSKKEFALIIKDSKGE